MSFQSTLSITICHLHLLIIFLIYSDENQQCMLLNQLGHIKSKPHVTKNIFVTEQDIDGDEDSADYYWRVTEPHLAI